MAAHNCPVEGELRFQVWTRVMTYDGTTWQPGEWENQGSECRDLSPDETPPPTEEDVRREVVQFGLPSASTKTNPVSGRTLIGLPTNFYTERGPATFTLQVLEQPVRIRATPKKYLWTFGDATPTRETDTAGRPYPDLDITHVYQRKGIFDSRVQVRYQVQWDAGDGFAAIDGYITGAVGPASPITTYETVSTLRKGEK